MTEHELEKTVVRFGTAPRALKAFTDYILGYYRKNGRKDLPFRISHSPYEVLVSEIMLQQTQVERGTVKYLEFMKAFPDFAALARAPKEKLLRVWSGLGYNRRALALQRCAQIVLSEYGGELPRGESQLIALPCIGPYTAAAIRAFAFNESVTMLETNIRTVFLHVFFRGRSGVSDARLLPLITATIYAKNPRIWYYALMDYGVKLKKDHPNPSRRSKTYAKQSSFKGSMREARGAVLKAIVARPGITKSQLLASVSIDRERVDRAAGDLAREGFISYKNRKYLII